MTAYCFKATIPQGTISGTVRAYGPDEARRFVRTHFANVQKVRLRLR